jgi:hypothetical protein
MKIGDKVVLKSFNGRCQNKTSTPSQENYWILIGETGTIQMDPSEKSLYASFSKKRRVLVKFDKDLNNLGLIAHNNVQNALWILISDIEILGHS